MAFDFGKDDGLWAALCDNCLELLPEVAVLQEAPWFLGSSSANDLCGGSLNVEIVNSDVNWEWGQGGNNCPH